MKLYYYHDRFAHTQRNADGLDYTPAYLPAILKNLGFTAEALTPDRLSEPEAGDLLILGSGATAGSHLRQQSSILDGLSSILKAISDRRRLEILCRLSHGRSYCYELAEAMGIDASNMSRHLAQLNQYGLLHQEREHMINYYETNKDALLDFLQLVGTTIMS